MWKDEYQKQWYYKHREEQIQRNREWKIKNRERMLIQKKEYHYRNREKILERKKRYRESNQDKIKAYRRLPDVKTKQRERMKIKRILTNRAYDKEYYCKNREKILEYNKKHRQLPEVKTRCAFLERRRRRNNPRSNRGFSLELQLVMNNVRKRDNNTCHWYGCGLTHRQASIHVHHIFPRSEYPELELVEQYMICYCANHHGFWHRMRGDPYSEMINPRYQEGSDVLVMGY